MLPIPKWSSAGLRFGLPLTWLLAATLVPATGAQAAGFTTVQQSDAVAATGHSYADWAAEWWQNILPIPASANPGLDSTGANCQNGQPAGGPVFFLAGQFAFGAATVTRSCTVPSGKYLFLPFINIVDTHIPCPPPQGFVCDQQDTPQKLRENMLSWGFVPATSLFASVDGVAIAEPTPTSRPGTGYLACAGGDPQCGPNISIVEPADNILGAPAGFVAPVNVGEGYWLMLAPLTPGKHTLHFGGQWTGAPTSRTQPGRATTAPPQGSGGPPPPATPFTVSEDITYNLIVL
jgi:hypothetical protein